MNIKSKEVTPAAMVTIILIALVVVCAGGYYLFFTPKEDHDHPAPPGGAQNVSKKEIGKQRMDQMQQYLRERDAGK